MRKLSHTLINLHPLIFIFYFQEQLDQIVENQNQIKRQSDIMKQKIKVMSNDQEHMKAMLEALVKHHEINLEEDDIGES